MAQTIISFTNTFTIKCPNCGYEIENDDTGSATWTEEELRDAVIEPLDGDYRHSNCITCNFCDEEVTVIIPR